MRQKWKVGARVNKPTARIGKMRVRGRENIEIAITIAMVMMITTIKINSFSLAGSN